MDVKEKENGVNITDDNARATTDQVSSPSRKRTYRATSAGRSEFYYSDIEADRRLAKARDSLTGIGDTAYQHFKDVLESMSEKHNIEVIKLHIISTMNNYTKTFQKN